MKLEFCSSHLCFISPLCRSAVSQGGRANVPFGCLTVSDEGMKFALRRFGSKESSWGECARAGVRSQRSVVSHTNSNQPSENARNTAKSFLTRCQKLRVSARNTVAIRTNTKPPLIWPSAREKACGGRSERVANKSDKKSHRFSARRGGKFNLLDGARAGGRHFFYYP